MFRSTQSKTLDNFYTHLHVQDVARFMKGRLFFNDGVPLLTQWYAICLSDVGDYEGVKVKIGNSNIIREHLEVRGHFCHCHVMIVSHLTTCI